MGSPHLKSGCISPPPPQPLLHLYLLPPYQHISINIPTPKHIFKNDPFLAPRSFKLESPLYKGTNYGLPPWQRVPNLDLYENLAYKSRVSSHGGLVWKELLIPAATLQGHLWSNVCSKFHEIRGILKPIHEIVIWGCFYMKFLETPKKGYILTLYFELSWNLSAMSDCFQWTYDCAIHYDVRKSVFKIVQTDELSLYYELVNIYKYGEKSSFKQFSCFLKNSSLLKGFDFYSWFRKKGF